MFHTLYKTLYCTHLSTLCTLHSTRHSSSLYSTLLFTLNIPQYPNLHKNTTLLNIQYSVKYEIDGSTKGSKAAKRLLVIPQCLTIPALSSDWSYQY